MFAFCGYTLCERSSSRKLFWANKKGSKRKRTDEYCSVKGKNQYQSDTQVFKKPRLIKKTASRHPLPFPLSRNLLWPKKRSTRRKQTCRYQFQSDTHVSEKPRISAKTINLGLANSSGHSAFRLSQHPEPSLRLRREIPAPSRKSIFEFKSGAFKDQERGSLGEGTRSSCIMGNTKSQLLGVFPFFKKGNKAVDVKSDADEDIIIADEEIRIADDEIMISDDSSVEVIEITEDDSEDEFVISHQGLQAIEGYFASDSKDLCGMSKMMDDGVIPASCSQESAGMFDSLSLSPKCYTDHTPVYKKLPKSARWSDYNRRLHSDISSLSPSRPLNKEEGEVSKYSALLNESFVPLTKAEQMTVLKALSNANLQNVLVTHVDSNIEITGQVLQCLRPGAWLNDEVINVYLELLKERERKEPKKFLKCHFFNTFFYKRLTGGRNYYDYNSVRRWTSQKKLGYGLIECDKIFVPIHQGNHWCLAVINNSDKKIQYLDSLAGEDYRVLNVVARYLVDDVKDKSGVDIDIRSWKREFVADHPAQKNGSDCGVFMIKYIDFYSRGLGLDFRQANMSYFRQRTAKEILQLQAN